MEPRFARPRASLAIRSELSLRLTPPPHREHLAAFGGAWVEAAAGRSSLVEALAEDLVAAGLRGGFRAFPIVEGISFHPSSSMAARLDIARRVDGVLAMRCTGRLLSLVDWVVAPLRYQVPTGLPLSERWSRTQALWAELLGPWLGGSRSLRTDPEVYRALHLEGGPGEHLLARAAMPRTSGAARTVSITSLDDPDGELLAAARRLERVGWLEVHERLKDVLFDIRATGPLANGAARELCRAPSYEILSAGSGLIASVPGGRP